MGAKNSCEHQIEHLWILTMAMVAIISSFILQISPDGHLYLTVPFLGARISLPEACFSRRILGTSCPGCGLTRSFVLAAQGQFSDALRMNPMGPILFILCWFQIPYRVAAYLNVGRSHPRWQSIHKRLDLVTWFILVGLIATWAMRSVLNL